MRYLLLLFVAALVQLLPAQETITIKAETVGCSGPLFLYTFDGTAFKPTISSVALDGIYSFEIPQSAHRFYYIGPDATSLKPLILGTEQDVTLIEHCNNSKLFQIKNSFINKEYQDVKIIFGELAKESQRAVTTFRRGMKDPALKEEGIAMMAKIDEKRIALLDSLKQVNPFLARVASLNTYLSYYNYGEDKYASEIDYFTNEFFQFVDWSDEGYYQLPWVYEGFKSYTTTLSTVYKASEALQQSINIGLDAVPAASKAEKLALGGILTVLRKANHPGFGYYAQRYIDRFGKDDPQAAKDLAVEIQRLSSFAVGGEAPNFTQFTPEGEPLALNDLRGKVVLVDFWASWCGPCRKENPHVLRLYDEYKDKGFEVLGVSLDRAKDRWLQAIEKDGLKWLHVSDLKGWKNEVAQMYRVSSIPHTMLLDADGKIIARGLRGAQLEAKLAEIFE